MGYGVCLSAICINLIRISSLERIRFRHLKEQVAIKVIIELLPMITYWACFQSDANRWRVDQSHYD